MFWYIVICALMLYPFCIIWAGNISGKNTKKIALMSACAILAFFMALRDTFVGVDTKYYSYVFTQFSNIPWNKLFTAEIYATEAADWFFDFEPGYRIYNKLLSYLSSSGQMVTICNSLIIIALLYRLVRKNSPDYLLSIWLYLTLGVFQTEMNVTRNAIAILLVYNAFEYIKKKEVWRYITWCLIASSFHVAAIAFIPLYWIINYVDISVKRCVGLVIGSIAVGVVFPFLSSHIMRIIPNRFDKYFVGGNDDITSLIVGLLHAFIFTLTYIHIRSEKRSGLTEKYKVGFVMLLLNLCFFGLNIGLRYAARMAALFGPYLVVFIPQLLDEIKPESKKRNTTALVAIVSGILYIARLLVNNIGGTMPYQFFW